MLHPQTAEGRMQVIGHVAGGIDIGQRGPASLVHENPVVDGGPRGPEQLAVGGDTDAGDHQVALEATALLGPHALDPTRAFERGDRVLQDELHTLVTVNRREHLAHLRTEDSGQRHRVSLDGGHLDSELPERCRDLGADEPETDHHGAAPGLRGGADPIAILHGAELEDAVEIGAGHRQGPVAPARGDEEPIVTNVLAALELDGLARRIDGGRAGPEPELDVVLGVVGGGIHELILEALLAAQVSFRERWPVVGRLSLGPDEQDFPVESFLSQHGRRPGSGQRGADDRDRCVGQFSSPAKVSRSPAPAAVTPWS